MSWQSERHFERVAQELDEQYEHGEISGEEHTKYMNELGREYREAAREAAEEAYWNELGNW